MKVMVWEAPVTVMLCWAWVAAAYWLLPAWLASMTQVPMAVKETADVVGAMVQPLDDESRLKTTVPPGAVAVGV